MMPTDEDIKRMAQVMIDIQVQLMELNKRIENIENRFKDHINSDVHSVYEGV